MCAWCPHKPAPVVVLPLLLCLFIVAVRIFLFNSDNKTLVATLTSNAPLNLSPVQPAAGETVGCHPFATTSRTKSPITPPPFVVDRPDVETPYVLAVARAVHDQSLALATNHSVLLYLKLETLVGIPGFGSGHKHFVSNVSLSGAWSAAFAAVRAFIAASGLPPLRHYTLLSCTWGDPFPEDPPGADPQPSIYSHHLAHAAYGFYDSPFQRALVVSLDGGANDGHFHLYIGDRDSGIKELHATQQLKGKHRFGELTNWGKFWRWLAHQLPEVRGTDSGCSKDSCMVMSPGPQDRLTSYTLLGHTNKEWVTQMRKGGTKRVQSRLRSHYHPDNPRSARDLAASTMTAMAQALVEEMRMVRTQWGKVDGIVLTGGVVQNGVLNFAVLAAFGLPTHVPADPTDGGLSLGLLALHYKPRAPMHVTHLGPPPGDYRMLPQYQAQHCGRRVTVEDVVAVLGTGAFVAVVQGRQDVGPRSLGHRCVLASPAAPDCKSRALQLMQKSWFEFVPVVAPLDQADTVFREKLASPYMSFVAHAKPGNPKKYLANISNTDRSLLVQTVTEEDNPLLYHVTSRMEPFPVLVTMPLAAETTTGLPVNNISEALAMLRSNPFIDYLLVQDILFAKAPRERGCCGPG